MGSNAAKFLRIQDLSSSSLKKINYGFFDFYPYLIKHLRSINKHSEPVLKIRLLYGVVASHIVSKGPQYLGLDIADGLVNLTNLRGQRLGLTTTCALAGNVLQMTEFSDSQFGSVISIGSLHHTGEIDQAISEVARVTRDDGLVIGMVYSHLSIRHWIKHPKLLLKPMISNFHVSGARVRADEDLGWLSEEYFSRPALSKALLNYGKMHITSQNVDSTSLKFRRGLFLAPLPSLLELDLYFESHISK